MAYYPWEKEKTLSINRAVYAIGTLVVVLFFVVGSRSDWKDRAHALESELEECQSNYRWNDPEFEELWESL